MADDWIMIDTSSSSSVRTRSSFDEPRERSSSIGSFASLSSEGSMTPNSQDYRRRRSHRGFPSLTPLLIEQTVSMRNINSPAFSLVSKMKKYIVSLVEQTPTRTFISFHRQVKVKEQRIATVQEAVEKLVACGTDTQEAVSAVHSVTSLFYLDNANITKFIELKGTILLLQLGGSGVLPVQKAVAQCVLAGMNSEPFLKVLHTQGTGMCHMWSRMSDIVVSSIGSLCFIYFGKTNIEERSESMPFNIMLGPLLRLAEPTYHSDLRIQSINIILRLISQREGELEEIDVEESSIRAIMRHASEKDTIISLSSTKLLLDFSKKKSMAAIMISCLEDLSKIFVNLGKIPGAASMSTMFSLASSLVVHSRVFDWTVASGLWKSLKQMEATPELIDLLASLLAQTYHMSFYICDVCGTSPILPERYNCLSCLDFNMCPTCFTNPSEIRCNGHSEHHTVVAIPCGNYAVSKEIYEIKLYKYVNHFLSSGSPSLVHDGVCILRGLLFHDQVGAKLIDKKYLEVVFELVTSSFPFVREAAFDCLLHIFQSPRLKERAFYVVKRDHMKKLMSMVGSPDAPLRNGAARTLSIIAKCKESNQDSELLHCIMDNLVERCSEAEDDSRLHLLSALESFVGFFDRKEATYLVERGVLPLMAKMIPSQYPGLRQKVLRIVSSIASFLPDEVVGQGIHTLIGRYCKGIDPSCYEYIANIFKHISTGVESGKRLINADSQFLQFICCIGSTSDVSIQHSIVSGFSNLHRRPDFPLTSFGEYFANMILHVLFSKKSIDSVFELTELSKSVIGTVLEILEALCQSDYPEVKNQLVCAGLVRELLRFARCPISWISNASLKCLFSLSDAAGPLSKEKFIQDRKHSFHEEPPTNATLPIQVYHRGETRSFRIHFPPSYLELLSLISKEFEQVATIEGVQAQGDMLPINCQESLEKLVRETNYGDGLQIRFVVCTVQQLEQQSKESPSTFARSATFSAFQNDDAPLPPHLYRYVDISEVKIGELISRTSYSEVFKAYWKDEILVVKKPTATIGINQAEFVKEAAFLKSLRHPNIVTYYGASSVDGLIYILTEYLPNGSLFQLLHRTTISLPFSLRLQMAIDACRGMKFLHTRNPIIIHRDLKSPNLLVGENWCVKVADFGMSREKVTTVIQSNLIGTMEWMAPEILHGHAYSEKVDVYSFGIVLWELMAREKPYKNRHHVQIALEVMTKDLRPIIPEKTPTAYAGIIRACWDKNPDARPSFVEVLQQLDALLHEYHSVTLANAARKSSAPPPSPIRDTNV